jgi:hypothetical protein
VDLNGEVLPSDRGALLSQFRVARGGDGHGGAAMVVVTPRDRARGWRPAWSGEGRPDRVVVHRAALLAGAALRELAPAAMGRPAAGGVGIVMRPCLSDYDAVVRLNRALVPSAAAAAAAAAASSGAGESRAKRRRTSGVRGALLLLVVGTAAAAAAASAQLLLPAPRQRSSPSRTRTPRARLRRPVRAAPAPARRRLAARRV